MFKKKKAKWLAELVVERSKNRISYEEAFKNTLEYYENKPFLFGLRTHVDDDFAATVICHRILGIDVYCPIN